MSSKYDVVVRSYGISSIIAASCLNDKGLNVLLVDENPVLPVSDKGFVLYPYEMPMVGLDFSFGSFKNLKKSILIDESLGVVFRDTRLDFKNEYVKDDIKMALGAAEVIKFSKFLDDIKSRSLRSSGGINRIYEKHKISPRLSGIMNAILFVLSGVSSRNYRLAEASKLLTLVLDGVSLLEEDTYSIRLLLIKSIKGRIDVASIKDVDSLAPGCLVVDDPETIKKDFIDNFDRFKGKHSEHIMYPLSLYAKVPAEFVSSAMPQMLVFIDADQSDYYDFEDVYVVRLWLKDDCANIRVTSFIPFGLFDVDFEQHRLKIIKMRKHLEKLIPNVMLADCKYYPDIDFFSDNILKCFATLPYGDIIYDESVFEGLTLNGVSVAQKVLRKIKK